MPLSEFDQSLLEEQLAELQAARALLDDKQQSRDYARTQLATTNLNSSSPMASVLSLTSQFINSDPAAFVALEKKRLDSSIQHIQQQLEGS